MRDKPGNRQKPDQQRKTRLAGHLRDNLKKRKEQARARGKPGDNPPAAQTDE